jgi:selenocysteine-specific elongation factor
VVFYTPKQLVNIQQKLKTWYGSAPFAMTDFRDKLGTTRKYAVPLLDYFDSIGFTRGNNNQRRVL